MAQVSASHRLKHLIDGDHPPPGRSERETSLGWLGLEALLQGADRPLISRVQVERNFIDRILLGLLLLELLPTEVPEGSGDHIADGLYQKLLQLPLDFPEERALEEGVTLWPQVVCLKPKAKKNE
jgi:hypothetical protein